jgi:type 1 glutamine amidotransferase
MERLGRESGAFQTWIRTDSQWITKQAVPPPARNARNLDFFDAILFFGTGDKLAPHQKEDLLSFIRDDGKGFVGAHTGDNAFYDCPEYGQMIGGRFDGHPWDTFDARIVVEDATFPAMKNLPARFTLRDEIYTHRDFSRQRVHVLASLESQPDVAVAWVKMHGKGRVFYSTFGHDDDAWDNPLVQRMYLEALKWALRLTGEDIGVIRK